jgi:hypothetical protein
MPDRNITVNQHTNTLQRDRRTIICGIDLRDQKKERTDTHGQRINF